MGLGRQSRSRYYLYAGLVLVATASMALFLVQAGLKSAFLDIAVTKAQVLAIQSVNHAIDKEVVGCVNYRDLVDIHKDLQGKVVLIQPNTAAISQIAAKAASYIQCELESLTDQTISIPIGQALKMPLLATFGPKIRASMLPLGTAQVRLSSDFTSSGINQTIHRLFLEIDTNIKVVIPLVKSTTNVKMTVPLTEMVVVGEVPEQYWQMYHPGS